MRPYNPYFTPTDTSDPREYLAREFNSIKQSIDQVHDLDVLGVDTVPPREGMIRYADGVNWDPRGIYAERSVGRGPYFYDGTKWVPLFQFPAGIWNSANTTPLTLTGSWQTYLTVVMRPALQFICTVSGSLQCSASLQIGTQKQLSVSIRILLNGAEIADTPRWLVAHTYGSNIAIDVIQSVDTPIAFDPSLYTTHSPAESPFGDLTLEVQARTNNIGSIDQGYIVVNEVL